MNIKAKILEELNAIHNKVSEALENLAGIKKSYSMLQLNETSEASLKNKLYNATQETVESGLKAYSKQINEAEAVEKKDGILKGFVKKVGEAIAVSAYSWYVTAENIAPGSTSKPLEHFMLGGTTQDTSVRMMLSTDKLAKDAALAAILDDCHEKMAVWKDDGELRTYHGDIEDTRISRHDMPSAYAGRAAVLTGTECPDIAYFLREIKSMEEKTGSMDIPKEPGRIGRVAAENVVEEESKRLPCQMRVLLETTAKIFDDKGKADPNAIKAYSVDFIQRSRVILETCDTLNKFIKGIEGRVETSIKENWDPPYTVSPEKAEWLRDMKNVAKTAASYVLCISAALEAPAMLKDKTKEMRKEIVQTALDIGTLSVPKLDERIQHSDSLISSENTRYIKAALKNAFEKSEHEPVHSRPASVKLAEAASLVAVPQNAEDAIREHMAKMSKNKSDDREY